MEPTSAWLRCTARKYFMHCSDSQRVAASAGRADRAIVVGVSKSNACDSASNAATGAGAFPDCAAGPLAASFPTRRVSMLLPRKLDASAGGASLFRVINGEGNKARDSARAGSGMRQVVGLGDRARQEKTG